MPANSEIQQAAILAYRFNKGTPRILLISSLGTGRWVLPKGHLEPGLTARESAEFEAYEEAGIAGRTAKRSIGTYHYIKRAKKGGAKCRVRVFAMEVDEVYDIYPEAEQRKRKWMTVEKAAASVEEPNLQKLITLYGEKLMERAATEPAETA